MPRFKALSKPSHKELAKVAKNQILKERETGSKGSKQGSKLPGGITILTRPKAAPTSAVTDISVTSSIQQQKMKLRTRPVVEVDGEDGEWEGVDSGSSKERQANTAAPSKGAEDRKEIGREGFTLSGKQGRRVGRREREKEKRRLDALLGATPIPITRGGASLTSDDNEDSAGDLYDDDPEDEVSPSLARKFNKRQAETERKAEPYSSEGGEVLSAGLRAWHLQQRKPRSLGPSSLSMGGEVGFEAPGVGTGSGSRTPRPADNTRVSDREFEADVSLVLDEAPIPAATNAATGSKKKKRSRRARTLLSRSKSYPNLRAATELGTESLKRRLGFLTSGSGSGAASNAGSGGGLEFEPDLYLDQNKRNRLYILAHKLLTIFPEQKRDLKRVILKFEQNTLNGATSSSSNVKKNKTTTKKGHKRSASSGGGGYGSGGYGSGPGIGVGTTPSMASFSNPDYIDYDEPQDPAEFDIQGPAHTPGASIVHIFIDHSNILIGLLNFLKRHPPPQTTIDEYLASRLRLTSHSTPALIDVNVDGEISIPTQQGDVAPSTARTKNGTAPIAIPGKGKGKMPLVETPTPSIEDYPIPLPSFATARMKGSNKIALSKSLPTESFLSGGKPHVGDGGVSDSNDEGNRSDGAAVKKRQPPKFPRHIWHAALALILERGRPVSRRVVVTSSPLHQPMEKIMRLGYEVRVYIRVPDLGDGMDRREKENRYSNGQNGGGAGKSSANQAGHPNPGGAFGMSSSPASKGFAFGAAAASVSGNGGSGVGSLSTSFSNGNNGGLGTSGKKGHARHLSGYTSNESGSGSNRDSKGVGGASLATPAKVRYREQGVDELLQLKLHQAIADVDTVPKGSTIVLATGDGNVGQFNEDGFLGPVRLALRKGWKVELYAWEDGLSKSWRREFGEGSEYGQKGMFKIIPLEQFGTSLVEAAGW